MAADFSDSEEELPEPKQNKEEIEVPNKKITEP
jgi:hypothetical protein